MTTVSPKKGYDPSRVNEISAKLMENPEIAELIGELSEVVNSVVYGGWVYRYGFIRSG
ncbi:hypothetical protein [Auritidibacter ignavus]|uniref:hypothetical protein n=1 Tax=Auritidibacter ignavus TaxID=678932 RepID=UPI0024BBA802|nr:hypothetical protein [Auritidibacter ignavus]WHS34307.1 hypothetical protein QM403_08125 [Auritidibacter ignavus]